MYKLGFFVPARHLEQVKTALFEAGAGRIGNYDSCCWQTLGQGQFRPLNGSNPTQGEQGAIETVPEYRVETVCEDAVLRDVVAALRASHPYEEPAFDVVQLVDVTLP
jgi:structural toxin protein (hemagglutinin/hemolysin) RtxA